MSNNGPVFFPKRALLEAQSSSPNPAYSITSEEVFRFCFGRDYQPEVRISLDEGLDFKKSAGGSPNFYLQDSAEGRNDAVAEIPRHSFFKGCGKALMPKTAKTMISAGFKRNSMSEETMVGAEPSQSETKVRR